MEVRCCPRHASIRLKCECGPELFCECSKRVEYASDVAHEVSV
jgi:hypothetical protein